MSEKQHYVKVTFEFGTDVDGEYTPKNSGECVWVSMPYDPAVLLQNHAILPGVTSMIEKAGELGMETTTNVPPGLAKK